MIVFVGSWKVSLIFNEFHNYFTCEVLTTSLRFKIGCMVNVAPFTGDGKRRTEETMKWACISMFGLLSLLTTKVEMPEVDMNIHEKEK